ncbi:MAG TPA: hypothetical protein VM120_21210 [Bryobacteraceae bacterium]|nr:hypothetical protein [Bryobacteraceae bacterium]
MADFHQSGVVTTLHRLRPGGLGRLERELEEYSRTLPIGLVLPALYSEFKTPAMRGIVEELASVHYLHEIVVSLDRANFAEYLHACSFFRDLPVPVTVMWNDGQRMLDLFASLDDHGLSAGPRGKGRSCWMAYGYLLARGQCGMVAIHDCDILNYSRELLARLCYPVANQSLGIDFCKGYYARTGAKMYGRVTRLFMTPLIRAMETMAPGVPFLPFLDSFRYPLAGEFAMKIDLARVNRVPGDWGLEVGVLAEVYRNSSPARTCQVDLADNYEHKHQDLCADDPKCGLRKMACDIAKSLFRTLAAEGVVFSSVQFQALQARYTRLAEDMINSYRADAMLNGLEFDRNAEEEAIGTFVKSLGQAAEEFRSNLLELPAIPNWNRVRDRLPGFFAQLLDALSRDMELASMPLYGQLARTSQSFAHA